jgi:mRNA-degrading endonuclease RelE of RelBE toxin-antitoxin system
LWNDRVRLAEAVEEQWKSLNDGHRHLVRGALETIDEDPIAGAPLFEPLRGLWSFRTGRIRIIYRIVAEARFVVILDLSLVEEKETP